MDTRNGDLYDERDLKRLPKKVMDKLRPHLKVVKTPLTARQLGERKIRPHDSCTCGSGKSFKKCCMKRGR